MNLVEEGRDWRAALRRALDHPFGQFDEPERAAAQSILLNIVARAVEGRSAARLEVFERAAALLAEGDLHRGFLRLVHAIESNRRLDGSGLPDDAMDPRVGPALSYLRARYADCTLTLSDTARQSNLSKWHFDRVLKQVTGATFRHHLIEIRMGKAKELLESTRLEVKEVADKVGYKHVSHFSRHFKRRHGVSASEYRKGSFKSTKRNRG